MSSDNKLSALIPNADINVPPVTPGMHPLLFARIKLTAAAKQEIVLSRLDRLIDNLDRLFQLTGWSSIQADATRAFRERVASATIGSPDSLLLLDQLKQHMADITANLTAGDTAMDPTEATYKSDKSGDLISANADFSIHSKP